METLLTMIRLLLNDTSLIHYNDSVCSSSEYTGENIRMILTIFPPVRTFVICALICLFSKVTFIASIVNPYQTAPMVAVWSGLMLLASMNKSCLMYTL